MKQALTLAPMAYVRNVGFCQRDPYLLHLQREGRRFHNVCRCSRRHKKNIASQNIPIGHQNVPACIQNCSLKNSDRIILTNFKHEFTNLKFHRFNLTLRQNLHIIYMKSTHDFHEIYIWFPWNLQMISMKSTHYFYEIYR